MATNGDRRNNMEEGTNLLEMGLYTSDIVGPTTITDKEFIEIEEKPVIAYFNEENDQRTADLTSHSMPLKCKFCGKVFLQSHFYKGHIAMHMGYKEFVCQNCGKSFTYKSGLSCHQKKCGGIEDGGQFRCDICGKTFKKKPHLREHIRGSHSAIPRYSCHLCGKTFGWRADYLKHQRKHMLPV